MLTLETILDRNNLNRAYKAVVANKGSAGVDGMEVGDLLGHLKTHGPLWCRASLKASIDPLPCVAYSFPRRMDRQDR